MHPTLIPAESLLANVDGAMNAIAVHGDAVGPTLFYGAGAGELPTASAVVGGPDGDRARDPAREPRAAWRRSPTCPSRCEPLPLVPLGELDGRAATWCFHGADRPGVLGQIASVLGEHGIGIESVLQKSAAASGAAVPVLRASRIPRARPPCAARSPRSTVCPR